jgi:hypothetical protein
MANELLKLFTNNLKRECGLAPVSGLGCPFCHQTPPKLSEMVGPITLEVHRIEQQAKALHDLTGQILATLRVNMLRGTLTSADDKQLEQLMESWGKQRQSAKAA